MNVKIFLKYVTIELREVKIEYNNQCAFISNLIYILTPPSRQPS